MSDEAGILHWLRRILDKQLLDNHQVRVSQSALPAGAATAAKQLADNHQVTANQGSAGAAPWPVAVSADPISQAVTAERVFTAGGTAQTTTGAQNASIDMENPSGSGKKITIVAFLIQIDISGPLTAQFVEDPTITGGTAQTGLNHDFGSATAASAVVTSGVNIVSGGTTLSPRIFFKDVAPFLYQGPPFELDAGKNVSVQITGQSLTTINYRFNVTWVETDA